MIDETKNKPAGTQITIHGLYYKIGVHGKPFVWINGEWIRSSRDEQEINKLLSNPKAQQPAPTPAPAPPRVPAPAPKRAWWAGLSNRTANILMRSGFKSRKDVQTCVSRSGLDYMKNYRGFGDACMADLATWLRTAHG